MLDSKFVREHPDAVREAIRKKRLNLDLDAVLALDREVLELRQRTEGLQGERNSTARAVPKASPEERPALIARGKAVGAELKELEPHLREAEERLHGLLLRLPQLPRDDVPEGDDDGDNVELRREGELPEFGFAPLDHVALLERHGWAELERIARVSGSRSYALRGDGALLEHAVHSLALNMLAEAGLTPLFTTALVRPAALTASGHFPGGEDQVYRLQDEELMLAGTAEVPINSLYAGEILEEAALPLAFAGYSAAFRSEAGSAGRDVRGLMRVHEFRKLEQYVITPAAEDVAMDWFGRILQNAEAILQALELPYRVLQNCTGDMGLGKRYMLDLEAWVPSEGKYRETHSCSYLGDWQARRTGLRYRGADGRIHFAHTLNNTGIATPRVLVPLLEVHQQADGTVRVPAALRPYLGGREVLGV